MTDSKILSPHDYVLLAVENAIKGQRASMNGVFEELERETRGKNITHAALLEAFHDLFRTGILSPGFNFSNPDLPWFQLTGRGKATFEHFSRDPSNPRGYLSAIASIGPLNDVANSYLGEALLTYNAGCFKASAVMVGAASESLVLSVRDALVDAINAKGRAPSAKLTAWQAKSIIDAVDAELRPHHKVMPQKLRDSFKYNWSSFTQQIRAGRNDAGHPSSVAPVTADSVHASLLIFPELHNLVLELCPWISKSMP